MEETIFTPVRGTICNQPPKGLADVTRHTRSSDVPALLP